MSMSGVVLGSRLIQYNHPRSALLRGSTRALFLNMKFLLVLGYCVCVIDAEAQ
jgi:hypothetical protein